MNKHALHILLIAASGAAIIVAGVAPGQQRGDAAALPSAGSAAGSAVRDGSPPERAAYYTTLGGGRPMRAANPLQQGKRFVAPRHVRSGSDAGGGASAATLVTGGGGSPPAPAATTGAAWDGLRNPAGTPPDTQVAVGPSEVIEMVNSSAAVWSKTGTLLADLDLGLLFGVPFFNQGSDPRVIYDTQSDRFFAAYISYQVFFGNATTVQIAWSKNSSPVDYADWTVCQYDDTSGRLHDNPAIGVSDDKFAIASNVYAWPQTDPNADALGTDTIIVDKAGMLNNGNCPVGIFGPAAAGIIRPAHSLSPTAPLYMASLPESGGTTASLWTVTGTPLDRNLVRTRTDLPMAGTTMPPPAPQPGTSNQIETNDARALEAVWKSGALDVSANTGCIPAGDIAVRACVHLLQISTNAPAVTKEIDLAGPPGSYLYYPALRPDAADNLVVAYTRSSGSDYPFVEAAVLDPAWTSAATLNVKTGAGPYAGIDTSPYRWGDYSGAAVDPADGSVWVAGEYSASGATGDWGTFIARVQAGSGTTPTATPTGTATAAPSQTSTSTPSATSTATPTPTAIASATASATLVPTNTPSPTSTDTPVPTATSTPPPTNTPQPTATKTQTPASTPTNTAVPTATATATATRTSTRTPTATSTPRGHKKKTPTPVAGRLSSVVLSADINRDGRVGLWDILLESQALVRGSSAARFDVNGDGAVDALDVLAVLALRATD